MLLSALQEMHYGLHEQFGQQNVSAKFIKDGSESLFILGQKVDKVVSLLKAVMELKRETDILETKERSLIVYLRQRNRKDHIVNELFGQSHEA